MWTIDKQFDFCYGHRVWTQELDKEYSLDTHTKCRHLHGHQATVVVHLGSDKLDKGMVTDFKHLGWLNQFLDDYLDHKFILDKNDPILPYLLHGNIRTFDVWEDDVLQIRQPHVPDYAWFLDETTEYIHLPLKQVHILDQQTGLYTFDTTELEKVKPDLTEFYQGIVLVNFVPTSEHLSQWLYFIVMDKMEKLEIKTLKVEWFETSKSRSTFSL